jgi:hypothetical protein
MPNTLFRPPLDLDQLKEIQARNLRNDDVRTLLWEIKRLQSIALRADQLLRSMPAAGGGLGMVVDVLKSELDGDPTIEAGRARIDEILRP